jgi:chromosome segregation ATPase
MNADGGLRSSHPRRRNRRAPLTQWWYPYTTYTLISGPTPKSTSGLGAEDSRDATSRELRERLSTTEARLKESQNELKVQRAAAEEASRSAALKSAIQLGSVRFELGQSEDMQKRALERRLSDLAKQLEVQTKTQSEQRLQLEARLKDAEMQLQTAQKRQVDTAAVDCAKRLQQLRSELQKPKTRAPTVTKDVTLIVKEHQTRLDECITKQLAMENELRDNAMKLVQAAEAVSRHEAEIQIAQRRFADCENSRIQALQDIQTTRTKALTSATTVAELESKLKGFESATAQLEMAERKLQGLQPHSTELEKRVSDLAQENGRLRVEAANDREARRIAEESTRSANILTALMEPVMPTANLAICEQKSATLTNQLTQLQSQFQRLNEENQRLTSLDDQVSRIRDQYEAKLKEADERITQLQTVQKRDRTSLDDANRTLKLCAADSRRDTSKIEELSKSIESNALAISGARSDNAAMQSKLAACGREKQTVVQQLAESKQQLLAIGKKLTTAENFARVAEKFWTATQKQCNTRIDEATRPLMASQSQLQNDIDTLNKARDDCNRKRLALQKDLAEETKYIQALEESGKKVRNNWDAIEEPLESALTQTRAYLRAAKTPSAVPPDAVTVITNAEQALSKVQNLSAQIQAFETAQNSRPSALSIVAGFSPSPRFGGFQPADYRRFRVCLPSRVTKLVQQKTSQTHTNVDKHT